MGDFGRFLITFSHASPVQHASTNEDNSNSQRCLPYLIEMNCFELFKFFANVW